MGRTLLWLNRMEEAASQYQKAIELISDQSSDKAKRRQLVSRMARDYHQAALAYQKQGDLKVAKLAYKRAIAQRGVLLDIRPDDTTPSN